MKILVLGATGGTGRLIVAQAREAGHEVTVFDRHAGVSMAEAMKGQDAVISAIGRGKSFSPNRLIETTVPIILSAMKTAGVRRLIFMSALGVGASYQDSPILAKLFFNTLLRGIYADKLIGDRLIEASDLEWTIVQPVVLTDGPLTGTYRVGERLDLKGMPQISRADTAQFILKQLDERRDVSSKDRSMQLLARSALVVLIAATLAGCYESAFPLDPASQAPIDAKLLGNWRCLSATAHGDAATLVISRARDGVYAASIVEDDKTTDKYEAHASLVGGTTVLNVKDMKASAKPWVYGRYELFKPDLFQFQVVGENAMKGVANTAAAVRGAIERQRTAPGLFEDGITCVRIKDAK